MAAAVVKGFEHFLEQQVQLSLFVPLIMGHGGNAGSQSCSAVLRALALQQVMILHFPTYRCLIFLYLYRL